MPTTQKLGIDSCDRDFVLLEELHRSAGGSVYRAKHKSSGTEVVIKERISAELGGKGRDAMRHELKLYERLSPHPNVIGLLGAFWRGGDAASSSGGYGAGGAMPHGARLAMVFEYAEQGDMHRYLEAQRATGKYLSERQALSFFRQVAAGTYHLHANGDAAQKPPPPPPASARLLPATPPHPRPRSRMHLHPHRHPRPSSPSPSLSPSPVPPPSRTPSSPPSPRPRPRLFPPAPPPLARP